MYRFIYRRSAKNSRGVARRGDGAGHGAVPRAAGLGRQRGRRGGDGGRGGHAAPRQAGHARQVAAAALARLHPLPKRRREPTRVRRKPRRLFPHGKTLGNELLRLPGNHHQSQRRLSSFPRTTLNTDLVFFSTPLEPVTVNIRDLKLCYLLCSSRLRRNRH